MVFNQILKYFKGNGFIVRNPLPELWVIFYYVNPNRN